MSGQVRSSQVRSDQFRSNQVRSGQIRSGQVWSALVWYGQVMSDEVRSGGCDKALLPYLWSYFVYCCTLCIFRIYFGHFKNQCYFCFSEGQLLRPLVLFSYLNPAQPNSTHTTHLNSSKHFTTLTSPTIFNQYQHN